MATTTTVHGQLIRYDSSGNQTIINLKSTGTDVSVDRSQNTKLPSSVSTVQTLANALKALAFKDSLSKSDVGLGSVDYGVYAYFPWTYCNGNFTIMGRFTKFVYDGTILDSAPTVGTEQEVRLVKMITGDTVVDDDELLYVSKTAPNKACIWAKLD